MLSEAARTRLIKLLNLTTSREDNEALSAIRRVNELLAKEGHTWEIVLGFVGRSSPRPSTPPPPRRNDMGSAADRFDTFQAAYDLFRSRNPNHFAQEPRGAPGQTFWVNDTTKISWVFDQLLNTGLAFGAGDYKFITETFAIWKASGRITDVQFSALAALLERERRTRRSF